MTDIDELIARLRHVQGNLRPHSELCKESADAIETLRAELEEARKLLDRAAEHIEESKTKRELRENYTTTGDRLVMDIKAARQQQG